MLFRYRFKGKVNSQFVIRGFLFKVGSSIDFCVSEKELDFVKQHCADMEIIDLEPKQVIETPKPVLEEQKTESESKPKGVNNENQTKRNGGKNQSKH